jgi:1-acyl-sn-glycerol-3-phosphate acyltransferase
MAQSRTEAAALHDNSGSNGNGSAPTGDARGALGSLLGAGQAAADAAGGVAGVAAKAAGGLASGSLGRYGRRLAKRLQADFDDRDPDYIREQLPLQWLISSLWFRGQVRGLDNVPEEGPVLLVGNHSGGNVTPDTIVFTLAFQTYFGVERRFHQLAHNLVMAMPQTQLMGLRRFGTVAASHEHAEQALRQGAALLVYPGGDWEVHRPSWESSKIDFQGRRGFVKLALNADVPIVPVVAIGGQETALFLSRGEWLAKLLGIDRSMRLKVLPISLAVPWGLNIGDFFAHVPLPAKITIEVLPPIHIRDEFGAEPDVDEVYRHVTGVMQDTLTALAAERRLPLIG